MSSLHLTSSLARVYLNVLITFSVLWDGGHATGTNLLNPQQPEHLTAQGAGSSFPLLRPSRLELKCKDTASLS